MMWKKWLCVLIFSEISVKFILGPTTDPLRASVTNQEQRAFIKIHLLLGDTPAQIYRLLHKSLNSLSLSQSQVQRVYNEFSCGDRESCDQQPGQGRPRTATDWTMKERLINLLLEDNDWGTQDYADELGISKSSVYNILMELEAKYVAASWVPHELTEFQNKKRLVISAKHLKHYEDNNRMLNRKISIDETF